ncbi:Hsp20/alpha crystallin family protein [Streptomyces sp. NPDC005708]
MRKIDDAYVIEAELSGVKRDGIEIPESWWSRSGVSRGPRPQRKPDASAP